MFNKRSVNFGDADYPMFEVIEPGAFRDVLNNDVRALVDHQGGLTTLARTKSGTLKLSEDEIGLRYEFEVPNTQAGRDLVTILERGDIDQSSFGFQVNRDGQRFEDIEEDGKSVTIRTISKVSRLLDVSPVTFPAYPDTVAVTRSFDEHRQTQQLSALDLEKEERARQIKLAELGN
jgi:HK97 family phage prohead protease